MKSVKRLSRYTSILLSLLLMLSAVSPGLTALAQEKANAAPTALTYEDDSITAELKAAAGTSLPAGAALTVKALSKDSQDETEKALYAQTEAGLNAKAGEQGTTIAGFTAYSITLTDKNKKDITPSTGSFTLKVTDKNAAAPEAYKQSTDEQKSVALYQAAEAKDEQNNPVSTMEPKQEDAASINTDPDGNVTGVETALTTLKPVAVTWQNPQQPQPQTAANEALSVQSSPELADNQFKYNFEVNGNTQNFQNFSIYFLDGPNIYQNKLDISELLENRIAAKSVSLNTPITMEELMPEGLNYRYNKAQLIGTDGSMHEIRNIQLVEDGNGYFYRYNTSGGQNVRIPVNDTSWTLYFTCDKDFEKVKTIDSVSKGVTVQMFDYDKATPPINWGNNDEGKITQNLLKRNLNDDLIPVRNDNQGALTKSFSTENNSNYKGEANNLFRADKYNESNTFYYSSFENYAYWNGTDNRDKSQIYPFTVYNALGTPQISNNQSSEFFYWRGNFMPYNRIFISEPASPNVNRYDPDGNILKDEDKPANRKDETLYLTQGQDYYFGMVVTADFSQLKDGMIKDKTGKSNPMVYDFNGDDDMWVFIDGVLVLDLGGIHDAHSGSINFANGEVQWTDWKSGKTDPKKETVTTTTTIREQFELAGSEDKAEWSKNGEGNTFADYTGHEIKIFYMERGAGASNCKMQFNLPTVPKDSVSITKEVTNVNEGAYTDVDFDFKLYVEPEKGADITGKETIEQGGTTYVLATDQLYDLKEGTEIKEADKKTNEDTVIFTLKHGQTAYFEELATQGQKYIVQEVGVSQDQYDVIKVNGEAVDENGGSITGEGDNRIIQTKPLTVGTNTIVKMQNHCDGEKLHTIDITKQIDGGQASEDTFTAQVTIGGKPYTGAYTIVDKDDEVVKTADECKDGEIELQASQTIRIEKIAAGTSFAVTEKDYDTNTYKTPTYAIAEDTAEVTGTESSAAGKVQFGSNPQITITNHKNFSAEDLEVNKTATVDSWEDRTYDIRLEASSNLKETVNSSTPYDIVLVLDSSVSMSNGLTGHTLYNDNEVIVNSNDYYYKTDSGIFQKMDRKADEQGLKIFYTYNDADSGELVTVNTKKSGSNNIAFDLTEAQKGRIYWAPRSSNAATSSGTKKQALEKAAASFLDAVNKKSPDSRVGVVTFGDNSKIKANKDGKTLLRVGTDGSLDQLKKWTAITPAGATAADKGMASAETVFKGTNKWQDVEQKENREKLVVFFTDGVPTNGGSFFSQNVAEAAVESAQSIKQNENATIYAIGIFGDANSTGWFNGANIQHGTIKQVDTYMKGIASPNCYMTTDNMEELKSLFGEIAENMGKAIKGATITDVIDSRFELTAESKEALESAGAKITSGDDGTTTITWTNQTINAKTTSGKAGWAADIKVGAKADYIGGNNVPTNVAGTSNVTVNGIIKPFDQPAVNVKADISLLNQANTIFWDETVPNEGDLLTRIQAIKQKSDESKKKYSTNDCQIEWKDENGNATSIEAMTQDKPEKDTHYTVNVSYDAGAPSEDGKSTENTGGHKNGVNDNNTVTAEGRYDVHVVKGQLEITKTIDEPYTNIKQINANQTFVFKIERYEVNGDGNKGKLAETFYETINFNANETETEKTKLVSGLKKGYYTVTEETNWSQKYELKTTTDNYDKNNNSNGQEAVDLLIGDRLKEATQDNPKPEFYGLDETVLHDSDGEKLPENQQYSHFAEGSKATVKFTNNLSTTWKWLSDTAAAVNVFDKTAQ